MSYELTAMHCKSVDNYYVYIIHQLFLAIQYFITMIIKVTGHSLWRFAENRYCTLNISPIFITFSPNTKYGKVVK